MTIRFASSSPPSSEAIRRLGLEPAASLAEALASASRRHGPDAPVVVIPDGVAAIITQ